MYNYLHSHYLSVHLVGRLTTLGGSSYDCESSSCLRMSLTSVALELTPTVAAVRMLAQFDDAGGKPVQGAF